MVLSNKEINDICFEIVTNSFSKLLVSRFYFEVLLGTGLRFNDVGHCFLAESDDTSFTIYPSKRNNTRTILFSDVSVYFSYFVRGIDTPLFRISYSSLLRDFQRSTPIQNIRIGEKQVLLHIFRHNYMKKLFDSGRSIQEIATITGEKHVSSASNYVLSHLVV